MQDIKSCRPNTGERCYLNIEHTLSLLSRLVFLLLLAFAFSPVGRSGWIDPDTTEEHKKILSLEDGSEYTLVMSDEFEVQGRSFDDGHDPMWTSTTHSDDAMTSSGLGSLHFYNASYATTNGGRLNITTTDESTRWRGYNPYKRKYETLEKFYRSSMLTTWNKFCFTGGIVEINATLPGEVDVGGLWPAFWLLGNLGRATYEASTNLLWPWSFNKCDHQLQRAQEISACNKINHFGMHSLQGRGSTEIDILEAQAGRSDDPLMNLGKVNNPYVSTTLQLAPGISQHRPTNGKLLSPENVWYKDIKFGDNSSMNYHFYGMRIDKTDPKEPVYRGKDQAYLADAISALTPLTKSHFKESHNYKLEWIPGPGGYLRWYIDDEQVLGVDAHSVEEHGTQGCDCHCYDCKDSSCHCGIPPGLCSMLPSFFMVDFVRVYQRKNDSRMSVGCDVPSHPSRRWIQGHRYRYMRLGDKESLKKIQAGGGRCRHDGHCHKGTCKQHKCHCGSGWVGPRCQVVRKFDDVTYDEHVDLSPQPIAVPVVLRTLAGMILAVLIVTSSLLARQLRETKEKYLNELRSLPPHVCCRT